jgi:FkbM family methyltransferase
LNANLPARCKESPMTVRDVGLAVVGAVPWLESVGRWVYVHLPEFLHDTPTSRLREHFSHRSRVTFVQIGAFDGVTGDPIRPLVLENAGWTGVMVEPQPDAFERLQRNYAAQSQRLQFLNAAISDEPNERTLFYISQAQQEALGLPDWASQLPSFSPEHLSKHFPHAKLASHSVRTTTFEEAANLLPAGAVDVVVIDTEGHERVIIDTINLDRHRVTFVMFEHMHLSELDRCAVERKLQEHGFSLKRFSRDTVAWRALAPSSDGSA